MLNSLLYGVGTMDSNMSSQFGDSQRDDDDAILSQATFHQPNFYPFTHPPFPMPPHGFTSMLTSPSPGTSFLFRPPNQGITPQLSQTSPPLSAPLTNSTMVTQPSPYYIPQSPLISAPSPNSPMLSQTSPYTPQPSPSPCPNSMPVQSTKGHGKTSKRKSQIDEDVVKDSQAPSKKPKASKKKAIVDLGDDDDNDAKGGKGKWKDFWVDQLIHVRGGMNEVFNNPVKQGVNLWAKVATQLAATYPDFDKDSEGCRKKFQAVLAQYRIDKAHNSISGNDRRRTSNGTMWWMSTTMIEQHPPL